MFSTVLLSFFNKTRAPYDVCGEQLPPTAGSGLVGQGFPFTSWLVPNARVFLLFFRWRLDVGLNGDVVMRI